MRLPPSDSDTLVSAAGRKATLVISTAKTPKEYIDSLPDDRRETIKKFRTLIRKNLPKGYKEAMRFGMLSYEVPLSVCPDTYNGEPLMYAGLAAQKKHYGVYLCGMYLIPEVQEKLVAEWKKRETRLDMGRSCLRIPSWEKCEPDLIADAIASVPMKKFVAAMGEATGTGKNMKGKK